MIGKSRKNDGWMMTELIVAMTLLGMLLVALATALDGFRRLNHYHLTKLRCTSAAQATLDSIAASAKPLAEADVERLWPGMSITIEQQQGSGQWEGMALLKVTAGCRSLNKNVQVRLCRYLEPSAASQISKKPTSQAGDEK